MKILMIADTSEWLKGAVPTLGGLERQVYYIRQHLEAKGLEATLANLYFEGLTHDDIAPYDLVHIYNTGGPKGALLMALDTAKRLGKPVVFTPVYWPPSRLRQEMEKHGACVRESFLEQYVRGAMRRLVAGADAIAVNARLEWEAILGDLGISYDRPVLVVPNAIDMQELEHVVESPFRGKRYVFCAGRIEWRKNQYGLAHAIKLLKAKWGLDMNLLLAGENTADARLLEVLKRALDGVPAAYIGAQPAPVIYGAMLSAAVYCQPSFYETPGLASLEAAALGVPLVVGCWGSEMEYFGSLAEYCVPNDPESIAEAIVRALSSDAVRWETLKRHVRRQYTYEAAAQQLCDLYRSLVP